MSSQANIIPIILSGGTGTRLWPLSRESHPKPFIALPDGQTLLQKTFLRASTCSQDPVELLCITNKAYYLKSKVELEKLPHPHPSCRFVLEPTPRNTAPAILMAAIDVYHRHGSNAIMLVLPADHLIPDQSLFNNACTTAFQLAAKQQLVVFGINPTSPETGYGYIELGSALDTTTYLVKSFTEKPDKITATHYLQCQDYLWNAGMFCFTAATIIQAFQQHMPEFYKLAETIYEEARATPKAILTLPTSFNQLDAISIDYAIMEKANNIAVVKSHFAWHDIGSWEAYKNIFSHDAKGNTIFGEAIAIDSHNNLIHSDNRMIAAIGIHNLAIIDTPDAVLITDRTRSQDVKDIVHTLKERTHDSYLHHRTVIRPWGSYTVLEEGIGFKIKRIVVKPQGTLSLQQHQHRSEHWVVIEGTAKVQHNEREYILRQNESTFIPQCTAHRLSNPYEKDLVIIEVQTGSYVGEDDIIRLEDNYGRVT